MDDVDELVEAFVAELAQLPPYREELIPRSEVRQDAESSFEMLLRLIAGLPLTDRLAGISEQIGRRRAQAGMPLDVLLQAVRLDFRILWAALLRRATPGDLQSLVAGAVTVWEAVEQHTVGVHVAYLDEAAVLAREQEQERSRIVAQLLSTDGRDAQIRAQVATALEIDPAANFAIAAADPANERTMRDTAERLRANGITAHIHVEERRPVIIAQLPRGSRTLSAHWLRGTPCGLGPTAQSLAAIPRSVRIATEVSKTIGPDADGPQRLQQVWHDVAADRLSEVGNVLAEEVLSEFDTATAYEQSRLVQTATSFFATGSVSATAKDLFCHRNTVLNRLHRLGEMTGGDLTRPEHAVLVQLALRVRARADRNHTEP
jgi:hypothetical protein